ncbi:hypothetical protein [Spirillospora sp. CA-294931]|uniref:hypothetical protein n=1 Tax=Spirillospora sp. CA-294931 TaxID=3240042 RepID=UPI003D8D80CC
MPDWPLSGGSGTETGGITVAASTGAAVAAAATTNTKGAWVELIAATARDAVGLLVNAGRGHTATADFLVDLAVGAAGAEQVLVPNLTAGNGTNLLGPGAVFIPIAVPAGTRISARCQSTVASAISRLQVIAVYGTWSSSVPHGVCTAYGANTADSGGVTVDPGAVANTKGAWSQIVASTSRPCRAVIIGIGNQANSARSVNTDWLLDIALGGAGAETSIISDLHIECSTVDDIATPQWVGSLPIDIPAGTRLAARSQASAVTDANDRLFDVIIYGLD